PYGMVIPAGWANGAPMRLDFWCHGRGETLTELAFMTERRRNVGQVPADGRLVLHLYGRYCCANKFAGEVDLWEAYEHARRSYAIDDDRLFIRGFSMGGAAVWQFGAHYADRWCGISPGAGFSETPEFLNVFQNEDVSKIPSWQKTLWGWYNASDVPVNFTNAPLVAYSGELDKQKQAADVMARELSKVGVTMTHIIGPQTAHKIHPDSMAEIERRLAQMASAGRDRMPRQVAFETFFLRYNRMHWVQIDRMESHWTKARIQADAVHAAIINVMTRNVTAFTLDMPAGLSPQSRFITTVVKVDGQDVQTVTAGSDRSWKVSLVRKDGRWTVGKPDDGALTKRHGVSGPIDDAVMDAFLFVSPSGKALNEKVAAWTKSERERAVFEWRRQFRGDAPMKADAQVTEADIASRNLVLWGDPSSNAVLARIADRLPIKWTAEGLTVDGRTYAAGEHAPVLVYPNPLNPSRYVVINSGFTYREYDYLNNARQVPKLPDWAVIDLRTPPDSMSPGKVVDAGFFDDAWGWRKR
ncbi:MAG: prolyl oligopeptidase family serine peptidase, partial [Verrucomicrobiota bacterium]